ncbi:glycine receptor subunit alphaZ1-like [Montipora foliosa]|uniref:glycine receptor subunit alphaZ1-like n=1 Tax=Montipora foliosa TaxID=591990 RepID=UPI0035F1A960
MIVMCLQSKDVGRFPLGFALFFVLSTRLRFCYANIGHQEACNRSAEQLLTWINNDNDISSRPNKTGGPVTIVIESYILSISSINEENMEFSLDMFFRQRWNDSRLCYLPDPDKSTDQRLILNAALRKNIWKPDIYFRNSKEARFHLVPTQNILFGIHPDGCILMSARITTVLSCQMNFRQFPMDQQTCHFNLGSYSQTEDNVIVKWRTLNRGLIVPENLEIPQYDMGKVIVKNRSRRYNTGVFSEPEATFVFKRRLMFYVYGFYLPVTLVVLLSWISFWIDPDSTPARVSLGVITILAMGNFLHGGGGAPNVSYATALDVYMITCFVFVFACLLEYAAVHCALNNSQKADINEQCSLVKFSEPMKSQATMEGKENESVSTTKNNNEERSKLRQKSLAQEAKLRYIWFNSTSLERYSRVAFPLCFVIFNVAYWLTYLGPSVENHGIW